MVDVRSSVREIAEVILSGGFRAGLSPPEEEEAPRNCGECDWGVGIDCYGLGY